MLLYVVDSQHIAVIKGNYVSMKHCLDASFIPEQNSWYVYLQITNKLMIFTYVSACHTSAHG